MTEDILLFWLVVFGGVIVIGFAGLGFYLLWERLHRRQPQATPTPIRLPVSLERKSQAIPVRVVKSKFPMRGLDWLLSVFFRGGSISGF